MKITILGTGAYGLSLAMMFAENETNDITTWSKFKEEADYLRENNKHEKVLPGIVLPSKLRYTSEMNLAIKGADIIVIATPTQFVDATCKELATMYNGAHICIASKGIEQETGLFGNEILEKYIKTKKVCVISGPSFAIDIANYSPIGLSLGSMNKRTTDAMLKTLECKTLKLHPTRDVLGIEICGAIKNVMAIASGILDGMNMSESTKAMFITEALHDIKRLIMQLGGKKTTITALAGIGDLILTCTCTKSRNFSFGRLIGEKVSKEEVEQYKNETTIEGLYTLVSIKKLADRKKLSIPIIEVLHSIIFDNKDPETLIDFLTRKEKQRTYTKVKKTK